MHHLEDIIRSVEEQGFMLENLFVEARAIPFENFDCPICKQGFMSRLECSQHLTITHPQAHQQRPLFCEVSKAIFNFRFCFLIFKIWINKKISY